MCTLVTRTATDIEIYHTDLDLSGRSTEFRFGSRTQVGPFQGLSERVRNIGSMLSALLKSTGLCRHSSGRRARRHN